MQKIIIIDDVLSESQGYAYNIANRLGLKFDLMHPRGSDADIYLFLHHREADDWLHEHSRECAVILSAKKIENQNFTGAKWIADKWRGTAFRHMPMILMGDYMNGAGAQLIKEGFPEDRIVSQMMPEQIYAAVEKAYVEAISSTPPDRVERHLDKQVVL